MTIQFVAAGSLALTLLGASAAPAAAQTPPAAPPSAAQSASSGAEYKSDFEGGADLVTRVTNRGVTNTYKKGWFVGASYRIAHVINVVAALSGDYHKLPGYTAHIYAYSGGVRFQSGVIGQRFRPFGQILMGWAQDNGDGTGKKNHYPVVSPGIGTDVALARHVALRARLDFPLYMTFGDVFKGVRVSAGLAFPLGTR